MRRSSLLVLVAVLAGLALLAGALVDEPRDAAELAPLEVAEDGARDDAASLAPRAPDPAREEGAREVVDTASVARAEARREARRRRVVAPIEVRVEGLPTARLGGDRVYAVYDPGGGRVRFRRDALLAPGGRGVFDGFIAGDGAGEVREVRFELARHRPGADPVRLVLADGRESLRRWGEEPVRLRPAEPLVAVAFCGKSGGVVREAVFRIGLLPELAGRAKRAEGWLLLPRRALDASPVFFVLFSGRTWIATASDFPVDAEGWMRLSVDGLEANDRTLRVESPNPLPKPWHASVALRHEDEWLEVGLATLGTCHGPARADRDAHGWTIRGLGAGLYRVVLASAKNTPGSALEPREADLRLARSASVVFDGTAFRRNRRVIVEFPEGLSHAGLLPWRLIVDPESPDAIAVRVRPDGVASFDWIGPLPRTATIAGKEGPLLPGSRPLAWNEDGVATLDLSAARLHRCRVLPAVGGPPVHLRETAHVRFGGTPSRPAAQYALVEREDGQEVVWWEGADFRVVVATSRVGNHRSDPNEWLAVLGPGDLAGRETYRVEARPAGTREVELTFVGVEEVPDDVDVYAWFPDTPPSESVLELARIDEQDPRLLRVGSWSGAGDTVAVPLACGGVVLREGGRSAFVPSARLRGAVDAASLDWR